MRNKVIDSAGHSVLLLLCNSHRSEGVFFRSAISTGVFSPDILLYFTCTLFRPCVSLAS